MAPAKRVKKKINKSKQSKSDDPGHSSSLDNPAEADLQVQNPDPGDSDLTTRSMLAIENPLIIVKICQYLKACDLVEARQVNSIWKKEATSILKKITQFNVEVDVPSAGYSFKTDRSREPFLDEKIIDSSAYVEKLSEFPVQNLKISWPIIYEHDEAMMKDAREGGMSLLRILDNVGSQLKVLKMGILENAVIDFDSEFDKKVLSKVKSLEHLKLKVYFIQEKKQFKLWKNFDLGFPHLDCQISVSRLQLQMDCTDSTKLWGQFSRIVPEKLERSFPNVTELVIRKTPNDGIFEILNRFKSRKNITKLSLPARIIEHEDCEEYEELEQFDISYINIIRQISQKDFMINLNVLHVIIPIFFFLTAAEQQDIERMFVRYAPKLTELELNTSNAFWIPLGSFTPVEIPLPAFAKLRKLALMPFKFPYRREESDQLNMNFKFKFLTDRLDYATQFPVLQKLTLGFHKKSKNLDDFENSLAASAQLWKGSYQAFVPQENQIVKNVVQLDIPLIKWDRFELETLENQLFLLEIMERFENSFPNAVIPYSKERFHRMEKVKKDLDAKE